MQIVWQHLTAPSPALVAPDQCRQARLLASLILALLGLGMISTLPWLIDGGLAMFADSVFLMTLVSLTALVPAYLLSRTRRYELGALCVVGVIMTTVFGMVLLANNPEANYVLDYLVVSVLFSSLFLSVRTSALVVAAGSAGLLALPLILPRFTYLEVIGIWLCFFLVTSAIILLVTRQQQLLASDRRAMLAQQVEERTAELTRANQELERVARHKDEFLASMSHELRTPLNAILGYTELMLEEHYGPLTDRQQRAQRAIEASGRHLLALIADILDLAKIGAGRMDLDIGPVVVSQLCEASVQFVAPAAQAKGIRVQIAQDRASSVILADERRMRQILVNLLSNAVKFTAAGEVGLEVAHDEAAQLVRLTVWDTGIGIAPEDQERLFQPFIQLDAGLSRKYSGTGLGLALATRLAELHGGQITLTSAVGAGSRFTVTLPLRAASVDRLAPRASSTWR